MNRRLHIDVLTIFPELFRGLVEHSVVGRALADGLVGLAVHDLRDFTDDVHRSVDDAPFGGGGGMVLKCEPIFRAVESLTGRAAGDPTPEDEAVVLLSPAGRPYDQRCARRYSRLSRLVLTCGRYEGVDERVRQACCTEAVSVGDFVLSGGEIAAAAVVDSVVRLVPGALGNPRGAEVESHEDGLLEAPHYTRPASYRGMDVPPVLSSGDHEAVRLHRRRESLRLTAQVRPDLLARAEAEGRLDEEQWRLLGELRRGGLLTPNEAARVTPDEGHVEKRGALPER